MDCRLLDASDRLIWARACAVDAVLVTKDEDFVMLQSLDPDGAAVVWVRIGNSTRRELLAWFVNLLPDIEHALTSGERLIEIA